MTVTSNIHYNLSAWAGVVSYTVGQRVSNGGNAYHVITSGVSNTSGGPTGTTSNITDGTVHWKYLSGIDFTNVSSWASSIPGTPSQPYVGNLWNNGSITTTSGNEFFTISGHSTTSTNTITLQAAPGESFTTFVASNNALAYSTNGVNFVLPSSGVGGINYITVNDNNFFLKGIQFKDPNSGSGSTIIQLNGSAVVSQCIFDGFGQSGGATIIAGGTGAGTLTFANNLVVDRAGAVGGISLAMFSTTVRIANSTFVAPNSTTNTAINNGNASVSNLFVTDCNIIGYASGFSIGNNNFGSSTCTVTHCLFTNSSSGEFYTLDGTGLYNQTASNVFVSSTTDFRLKSGSPAIDAGITDTTDVPTSIDIVGTSRPQGTNWDIGPFEFISSNPGTGLASIMPFRAIGLVTTLFGTSRIEALSSVSTATLNDQVSGLSTILSISSVVSAVQQDLATAANTIEPISAVATFGMQALATSISTIFQLSLFSILTKSQNASAITQIESLNLIAQSNLVNVATAVNAIEALSASATSILFEPASGRNTILPVSCVITLVQVPTANILSTVIPIAAVGSMFQSSLAGTNTVLAITPVVTLVQSALAGVNTVLSISSSGSLYQQNARARNTIFQITGSAFLPLQPLAGIATILPVTMNNGFIQQQISISNILNLTAVVTTSLATINPCTAVTTILALKSPSTGFLSDQVTSAVTIEALTVKIVAGQSDQANTATTVLPITGTGIMGYAVGAVIRFFPLKSVSTATLVEIANGVATIFPISMPQVINLPLLTEAGAKILGDGLGTYLTIDVTNYNAFQSVSISEAATIFSLSAAATGLLDYGATGAATITTLASDGEFVLQQPISAAVTLLEMTASVTMQQLPTFGLATILPLSAVVATSESSMAFCVADFLPMVAEATTDLTTFADEISQILPLSVLSAAGIFNVVSGSTALEVLDVAAFGFLNTTGSAEINIDVVGSATADLINDTSGIANLFSIGIVASGLLSNAATAAINFVITTNADAAEFVGANAAISIGFTAAGNGYQTLTGDSLASVLPLTAVGVGVVGDALTGASTVLGLSASAEIIVFGKLLSGGGTIIYSAVGTTSLNTNASALVNINFTTGRNAIIYQTPSRWFEGDQVIFWSS